MNRPATGMLLAVLGLAWLTPAWAESGTPGASLDSLLEIARRQNPELAAMRLEASAAMERVVPAGALPDPTLRMELMDITNRSTEAAPNLLPGRIGSAKYTVIQPLPFWGKRDLKRDAAQAESEQARGRYDATWVDLAARIKATYAQYYLANRSIALTREMLALAAGLEQFTQARYSSGLVPQQDVLRAQVEQTSLKSDLLVMETERHHLHSRINTLLRRQASEPLAEPERLRPLPAVPDHAALEALLLAKNPQLFVAQAKIAAAEKNSELTERNRYPDFAVGVFPTQMNGRIAEWGVMLELNIPLQQETRRAQEREAQSLLGAAQARRDGARSQLVGELSENLAGLEAAKSALALTRGSLKPQAELNYQAALSAYENGKVDFATLLEAQRQMRRARLEELKAQVEAQLRLADIERLLGEDL